MNRFQSAAIAAVAWSVVGAWGEAGAASSTIPSDFRPVAVESSARAVWVNPSAIGLSGVQSLVVDGVWAGAPVDGSRLGAGDPDGISDLAYLSVAAATSHAAYAFRYEFDDVLGVPDWTLVAANRVVRNSGMRVGTAIEWRGGESQSFDATVSFLRSLGPGLQAALVVEDVFERDVDGVDGARRWHWGAAFRPPVGLGYVSWDYERLDSVDEGRHWFGVGIDRARQLRLTWAGTDDGEWSVRVGLVLERTLFSGGVRESDDGPRDVLGSIEWMDFPMVR